MALLCWSLDMNIVSYTQYKSPDALSKRYWLQDKAIQKQADSQMSRGTAHRVTMPFCDFPAELAKQTEKHAFGYGLHPFSYPDKVNLVVKSKEKPDKGIISRSLDFFQYSGAGIMMLDHDPSAYGRSYTPNELLEALVAVHPEIAKAAKVVRGSVSAGVHVSGELPRTDKGFHIYLPVVDTTLLKEYGALLMDRLWLAGQGFIALAANGALLERTCIDGAVFSPERLDFVGKPIISGTGLEYTAPEITYTDGVMLDISTLSALTPDEVEQLAILKADAKDAIKPTAVKQVSVWREGKITSMVAAGVDQDKAVAAIDQILGGSGQDLYSDFLLEFTTGSVTVSEVLSNPRVYDGRALADPVEGIGYGQTTAMFFWNDGRPVINSFAHGGCTYSLHDSIDELSLKRHSIDTGKPNWKQELEAHVQKMNQTYASTVLGDKHKIIRVVDANASYDNQVQLVFFNRKELDLLYANTSIQVGVDKKGRPIHKNHLLAWATHPNTRIFKAGVIFQPAMVAPDGYYNTWQGFAVKPMRNDALLARIYYHMREVVCAGHADLYNYLIKWIAFTVQYPAKPAGSAIVLRGEKGCGKGTLGHFLRAIWGAHGMHIANAKHLVGNFNGHLNDICFLFADEAFFSGDKQHEGVLKALITEPTIMIERKGIDSVQQPNYLKVFMATNSNFAVPASRDERRYCVFDVTSSYIGNTKYFNELHADCSSKEVRAAFLAAMQAVDLSGWHTGLIPDSVGLREQRYFSMDSVQKWLVDVLMCEKWESHSEGWLNVLASDDLYRIYVVWCGKMKVGEFKRFTQAQMGRYLKKVFEPGRNVGSRGKRGYIFGDVNAAKAKFEAYEKIKLNELIIDS